MQKYMDHWNKVLTEGRLQDVANSQPSTSMTVPAPSVSTTFVKRKTTFVPKQPPQSLTEGKKTAGLGMSSSRRRSRKARAKEETEATEPVQSPKAETQS